MTRHLSEVERIDALEGTLAPAVRAHLAGCEACRQEVGALRAVRDEVTPGDTVDVPEPSPLFWNHFHARVAAAVDADVTASATGVPWWRGSIRGWAGLAAAAVVVLVTVSVARWTAGPATVPGDDWSADEWPAFSVAGALDDTTPWQFVSDVLGTLEPEAARTVLEPSAHAVDAAFAALTAAEREEFARLLQAGLSEGSE